MLLLVLSSLLIFIKLLVHLALPIGGLGGHKCTEVSNLHIYFNVSLCFDCCGSRGNIAILLVIEFSAIVLMIVYGATLTIPI